MAEEQVPAARPRKHLQVDLLPEGVEDKYLKWRELQAQREVEREELRLKLQAEKEKRNAVIIAKTRVMLTCGDFTIRDVARRFNLSVPRLREIVGSAVDARLDREYIKAYCEETGQEVPQGQFTAQQCDEMKQLQGNGWSPEDLSRRFGVSTGTIRDILSK